jgi:hypothetical protein
MPSNNSFISFFKKANIELQRLIDHNYRRWTGRPTLKRSKITPNLYLGGQYSLRGLNWLKEQGITAIVNMRTTSMYQADALAGMKYLHLPTPDRHAPSLESLHEGVEFITGEITQGGKVYIHCFAGEGRGPSMALAYLISTGITLNDALALISGIRVFIRPTKPQLERLQEFETSLTPKKNLL